MKNETILITGGTTGIGLATAQLLAAEGARVIVTGRNPQTLAASLVELAGARGLRTALGQAARARVEQRFTLDRMIAEYRDAYYAAVA
jgi:NAD(P)-dependent dehydrogenase (short-subunit alcohol dehydrogenase family)